MSGGRQAKRLRGWELEFQKHQAAPLTKREEGQSSLTTKLLNLWAHGKLSAVALPMQLLWMGQSTMSWLCWPKQVHLERSQAMCTEI